MTTDIHYPSYANLTSLIFLQHSFLKTRNKEECLVTQRAQRDDMAPRVLEYLWLVWTNYFSWMSGFYTLGACELHSRLHWMKLDACSVSAVWSEPVPVTSCHEAGKSQEIFYICGFSRKPLVNRWHTDCWWNLKKKKKKEKKEKKSFSLPFTALTLAE